MKKLILFSALCFALSLFHAPAAQAQQEIGSLSYYNVPQVEYYDSGSGQYKPEYYQWRRFLEYNEGREPCQHYQDPPAGYVLKGCQVFPEAQQTAAAPPAPPPEAAPAAGLPPAPSAPQPITIYFDFDRSNIRESETGKIAEILDAIREGKIDHVVIAGHADTAGPFDHNMRLSQRRAAVVAHALTSRGINGDIIEQKAYGETDLAVPTPDNTPLQANRRSVIIFVQQEQQ